ncbi:MAG: tagaturonate epimerase family protein [bacterium]|nr:tagaturonate epimerase family protein [candidate division KSB1 bacterium]MDH7558641.1 tagaturonate epimerase family protein [bacterium]
MELGKYSFGLGDRFGLQGKALLQAVIEARALGVEITPVWNKSYREHLIVGSTPAETRKEADEAVQALAWKGPYFVDADHVTAKSVTFFVQYCDFFTIDVAEQIGKPPLPGRLEDFLRRNEKYLGELTISSGARFHITRAELEQIGRRYLAAIDEAEEVYRLIALHRKGAPFVLELSMDETAEPQHPVELFFLLSEVARRGIPLATIAPRFPGKLYKGVDYEGNVEDCARHFALMLETLQLAIGEFALPKTLKLSLHSGSDKFSLYGPIREALLRYDAGLHIKTAGTTWLEELAGLAEVGSDGLTAAKEVYRKAYQRLEELVTPYSAVTRIAPQKLPDPAEVDRWSEQEFLSALRNDPGNARFNADFRQLLHVAYKIPAEMGTRYTALVLKHEDTISANVTKNLLQRHIRPLFVGE